MEKNLMQSQPPMQPTSSQFAQNLKKTSSPSGKLFLPVAIIAILLGIGTGYVFATKGQATSTTTTTQSGSGSTTTAAAPVIKVGQVFGSQNADQFKDAPAEGVLLPGGIGAEGSHHLVRPGGQSQTVYLTSSALDLSQFENDRIKVSGETLKGQKAGWLMDVQRVEVLELNAALPDWLQKQQTQPQSGSQD